MYEGYSRARLDDKKVTELIGLLKGIVSDNKLNFKEVEYLVKWMIVNPEIRNNPVIAKLYQDINELLSDGRNTDEKLSSLLILFTNFTGSDFEIGEDIKSSAKFFDFPVPKISIPGNRFAFTGTFLFGSRNDCEQAVLLHGGVVGSLVKATSYLVVGEYATNTWTQSSFGRKIERAMKLKSQGTGLFIVAESDWKKSLE